MDTTPITTGVLEGLDRFLALNTRPETQAEIAALKKRYSDRAEHEARVRSAREEADAAESALLGHGHPHEPQAIGDLVQDVRRDEGRGAIVNKSLKPINPLSAAHTPD
jgi:hypothetical protein